MQTATAWPAANAAMPAFVPDLTSRASESRPAMNINRLDLASIRLVVLCAQLGSLSEAARRCHLSLSGASHRLKSFEEAIGQPVFERHRRGMRPTPAGQQIVFCAEQLLEWIERLARQARHDPRC